MKNITYLALGFVLLAGVAVPSVAGTQTVSTASCPNYIKSLLKRDSPNNNRDEVLRLQTFLKVNQGYDVDVNGTFDAKTEAAVSAFQIKYKAIILAPWGASIPSGTVSITTSKQINNLVCGKPLTMDKGEMAVLDAYVSGRAQVGSGMQSSAMDPAMSTQTSGNISIEATSPVTVTTFMATSSGSSDVEIMSSEGSVEMDEDLNDSNKTSLSVRFWLFIKGLFR